MAVATATALGIAAAASTAAGAGMSFAQAAKQSRLRREADEAAQKAIEEAKKAINVNTYAALNVPMLPYQLQREALAQATAQAMEAAKESGRGGGAMAGRVLAEAQQNQLAIASEQAQEIARLEQLKAAQQKSIQDALGDISLAEAGGAQLASRQAQIMQNQAITQGVQQLGSLAGQIAGMPELYPQNKGGKVTMGKYDQPGYKPSTPKLPAPGPKLEVNNAKSFTEWRDKYEPTKKWTPSGITPEGTIPTLTPPYIMQNLPTQQRLPVGSGSLVPPYLLQGFINPFDVTGDTGG